MKGCLSGIPVGCGTNRNEVFHRYIRTFFHRSRVGMLIAYALMMVIIYQFNSTQVGTRKQLTPPITSFTTSITTHTEPMGIVSSPTGTSRDSTWHQDSIDEDIIDESSVGDLIIQSLSQQHLMSHVSKHSKTATNWWKFIQFGQVVPFVPTIDEKCLHTQRLKELVRSWKFSIVNVPEDGNCFFTSVALELSNFAKDTIQQLGLPLSAPITDLVSKLRAVMVEELLGARRYLYEEFFPDISQYDKWADDFRQNYFYDCDLGNIMPLAMANALSMSFVIFTSHERSPVYYVTPSCCTPTNILYVAYTTCGSGHYEACIPVSNDTCTPTKVVSCRCGINRRESDKENHVACNHNTSSRHSTCKCLAANKACTHLCKCKDCKNPNGPRLVLGKRKREAHDWQKINTSTADFANDRDSLVQGRWTMFENVLFVNVVSRLEREMLDYSSSDVCKMFNSIVSYVESPYCTISIPTDTQLRHKSENQCAGKLREYEKGKLLFQQIAQQ